MHDVTNQAFLSIWHFIEGLCCNAMLSNIRNDEDSLSIYVTLMFEGNSTESKVAAHKM